MLVEILTTSKQLYVTVVCQHYKNTQSQIQYYVELNIIILVKCVYSVYSVSLLAIQ